jgi:hypothetical protein
MTRIFRGFRPVRAIRVDLCLGLKPPGLARLNPTAHCVEVTSIPIRAQASSVQRLRTGPTSMD